MVKIFVNISEATYAPYSEASGGGDIGTFVLLLFSYEKRRQSFLYNYTFYNENLLFDI
jgi:hypothetical protein